MKNKLFRLANKLYEHCYPAYYPLYAVWKALSDRRERALLRQLIQPGMTVIDVGANIGVSIPASFQGWQEYLVVCMPLNRHRPISSGYRRMLNTSPMSRSTLTFTYK